MVALPVLAFLIPAALSWVQATDAAENRRYLAIDKSEVTWVEAVHLTRIGKVRQVVQYHSLTVVLTLNDGATVYTREPKIDAIYFVLRDCGAPCADIEYGTE